MGVAAQESMNGIPAEVPEEVYLSFRYASVVDSHIAAWYHEGQIYVPIGELFDLLQINHQFDLPDQTIRGFFLRKENVYELNFSQGQAVIGGHSFDLEASDFIAGERDIFVRPSLLDQLFDLRLSFDMSMLALWLDTAQPMPVVLAAARERNRIMRHDPRADQSNAPLLYGRKRKWIGGGLLDYTIATGASEGSLAHTVGLRAGMEVLGGGLRWDLSGTLNPSADHLLSRSRFEWQYDLGDNPWLTSFQAGTLGSSGLRPLTYHGVTLTNEPNDVRSVLLTTYQVEGTTQPDWEVELHLNGRLVDFGRADASGHYRFTIPLPYGTSDVHLMHYGPTGEVVPERRRLQIPHSFLPPGETSYTLHIGQTAGNALIASHRLPLTQAYVTRGLTSRITARLGMDYVGDSLQHGPVVYGAVSSRLGNHYLMSMKAAPSVLYELAMNGQFPSQAALHLRYTHHSAHPVYNSLNSWKESIEAGGYMPLHVGALPISVRLTAGRERYVSESRYEFRGRLTTRFRRANFYAEFQGTAHRRGDQFGMSNALLSPSLVSTLPVLRGWLAPLGGTSLRAQVNIDARQWNMTGIRMEFLTRILRAGHLHLTLNQSFRNRLTIFGFRFTYDLPSARTTTSVQHHRSHTTFVQTTQGSIGFDQERGRLIFANRTAVGQSAASVRLFVDENGNGSYDPGEHWVKDATVQLTQGGTIRRSDSITVHVRNLRPYTRYDVSVVESSIHNPLWVPRNPTFSFVTEPNTYKSIDIPLYAAGAVEGMVTRSAGYRQLPVPGFRVQLSRLDGNLEQSLMTFSDGSFYSITLPPGEYEARIDSMQLDRLGLRSDSTSRFFTVRGTANGDYIDGLNFVLDEVDPESVTGHLKERFPVAREEGGDVDKAEIEPGYVGQTHEVPADSIQFYTVQPSEIGLMNIARKVYDDGYLWPEIYGANRDKLNDPDLIHPGQQLKIPPKAPPVQEQRADPGEDDIWIYHTVRPADIGLMDIARKVYQAGYLWPKIWLANKESMLSPDLIYPGQRLRIPPKAPLTPEEQSEAIEDQARAYYTVRSLEIGLMNIARKVYDDGYLWPKIYVANRDKLNDPDLIYPGQRLKIPAKAPLTPEERTVLELLSRGRELPE